MNKPLSEKRSNQEEIIQLKMADIRHKIIVLSGKGGVGKSTVATHLAVGLARRGKKVALLDIDIHGPNIALMMGLEGKKLSGTEDVIDPLVSEEGVKVVSMAGMLPNRDSAVIWRGPLKMGVIRDFLSYTDWGALDFLLIDSPPGTGDEPLSAVQLVPDMDGAVIVTTPQEVALLDSRKCANFAKQVNLKVLGIVENMSGLTCPHCGGYIEPFKTGGGESAAKELGLPFLGRVPMDPKVVVSGDEGKTYSDPDSETGKAFAAVIDKMLEEIE